MVFAFNSKRCRCSAGACDPDLPGATARFEGDHAERESMRVLRILPGLIFGLAFAGASLFMLSETAVPTWEDWYAMRSWQSNNARLLSVSGSEVQTRARYRYQVKGVTYEGDRVYVAAFSDNIGSYHSELLARLRNQHRAGEPVVIWVNSLDPRQAVIDRDMRWGLFALISGFFSVFIVIGLFVSYASIMSGNKGKRSSRPSLLALRKEWKQKRHDAGFKDSFLEYSQQRIAELEQEAKGETKSTDWKSRKGWETPRIRSEARKSTMIMWGFAIFWNAVTSPLLFVVPKEFGKGNQAALFGLLFPLVGGFLLYKSVASTLEYRRFGKVLVEMDPFPGAIGGHVGGRIQISRLAYNTALEPASHLSVRLECVHSYMAGSGDSRSRRESIKWAEEGQPGIESYGRGVTLAFRFDVPDNLPESDVDQKDAYYFWRLTVKAQTRGVDLNRQYNLPVFKTRKMSRFVRHDVSAQVATRKELESEATKNAIERGDFDIPGLSRAMRLEDQDGELRMAFPMFRDKVLAMYSAIFATGFGCCGYNMIAIALKGGAFGIFIGIFSVPFVVVAVVASIATVYLAFNNLRVNIRRNEITVLRRLLFFPVFYRHLVVTDLSHLTIKRSGSTGQGVDKIEHFKLLAHDRNGKSVTLAEGLDGKDVAGHFRDYLGHRLNVESRPLTSA